MLNRVGHGGGRRTRPEPRGADRHRRRDRTDGRRVRLVLLQRARRRGRQLHAVHALRRAEGRVRPVPDAAQHGRVRADLRGRRHRPLRRHHEGPALRPQRAASRHAEGASRGAQLSRRAGRCRATAKCSAASSSATRSRACSPSAPSASSPASRRRRRSPSTTRACIRPRRPRSPSARRRKARCAT